MMLVRLREKAGLTQKDLATKLGIARTTYSGYENGAREPDLDTLKRIADFFEVSLDYLLNRDGSNEMKLNDDIKTKLNEEFAKLTKEEQENLLAFIERMPKKGK